MAPTLDFDIIVQSSRPGERRGVRRAARRQPAGNVTASGEALGERRGVSPPVNSCRAIIRYHRGGLTPPRSPDLGNNDQTFPDPVSIINYDIRNLEVFMNWFWLLFSQTRRVSEGPSPTPRLRTIHARSRKRYSSWPRRRPAVEGLETRFLLATGITEFPALPTPASQPNAVVTGPDGDIWFTEVGRVNAIGRMAPDGTLLGATSLANGSLPAAITVGPDGNLWFTEESANKIGRMSTAGTLLGEFVIPTANSQPLGITTGPDGDLWFVESNGNQIGRIAPDGTFLGEIPIPTANSQPVGITLGPDGNAWFTESGSTANKIGRITPAGVITEFSIPTAGSGAFSITAGPDGNLWFTEPNNDQVGQITVDGAITEFTIPTSGAQPNTITTGPDGNLWFTELGSGRIGEITPAGFVAAEYIVPTAGSSPSGIALGPHSSLIFAEFGQAANRLGVVGDVLDANHSFVQALYEDALGRLGSPAELDSWVNVIVSSGIGPVVNGIEHSAEADAHVVRSWYERYLGRTTPPSDSEIQGFVNALQAGESDEQVLALILSSNEFYNYANNSLVSTGTPDERFISALYLLLLNRTPSATELQSWVSQLPALGRQGIASTFLTSAEYRGDVIRGYYSMLLHRSAQPSAAEVDGWVSSGLSLEQIRIDFEMSLEFYQNG
jgi:streptogramin lyase